MFGKGCLAAEAVEMVSGNRKAAVLDLSSLTPFHILDSRKCMVCFHCVSSDVSPGSMTTRALVSSSQVAK